MQQCKNKNSHDLALSSHLIRMTPVATEPLKAKFGPAGPAGLGLEQACKDKRSPSFWLSQMYVCQQDEHGSFVHIRSICLLTL